MRTNPPAAYRPGDTVRTAAGVVQVLPPFSISGFAKFGTNLVWSGSNGVTDGTYYVLGTTNLALPMTQWARIATNSFDGNGNFQFTNPPSGEPRQFFRLQLP